MPCGSLEPVPCPLCRSSRHAPWGAENGFECVRCLACELLYVTPRPASQYIDRAVQLGVHESERVRMNVVGARAGWKVHRFRDAVRTTPVAIPAAPVPVKPQTDVVDF